MGELKRQALVNVRSLNYDRLPKHSWGAELIEESNSLVVLKGGFESEVRHSELGVIGIGTISTEYYWLDRWYNVFVFHKPDGAFRNFYCNVTMPPRFTGETLEYIDLDIDILVAPDFSYRILDLSEFEDSARKFDFSAEIENESSNSINELESMINTRKFPFDSLGS